MPDLLGIGTNRGHSMVGLGIGLGLGGYRLGSAIDPTLKLDWYPAQQKSLTSLVGPTPSYSRASKGWAFNASGTLTEHAINAPRFDHVYDGATWVSKGLLIEEQRTNELIYSQTFQGWTNGNLSIVTNSATSPDGTANATKLIPDAVSTNHRVFYPASGSGTGSFSCYAKAAGYNFLQVRCGAGGGAVAVTNFNLSNGTISNSTTASGATITGERMTDIGNGWWKCQFSFGSVAAFTTAVMPRPDSSATEGAAFSGDTTSGVLVWGVQTEAGAFPTSYIPTTSAPVIRSADVCQITGSDFSGIWNAAEGSFALEYELLGAFSNSSFAFTNTGNEAQLTIYNYTSGANNNFGVYGNGTTPGAQADFTMGSLPSTGTRIRIAGRFKANDFAATQNGTAVVTDVSGGLPTCDKLGIGSRAGTYANVRISRFRYYNAALPNATLERLST